MGQIHHISNLLRNKKFKQNGLLLCLAYGAAVVMGIAWAYYAGNELYHYRLFMRLIYPAIFAFVTLIILWLDAKRYCE